MFKKILLATDGTINSKKAEDCAFALAKNLNSRLTVLYVIPSFLFEAKDLIPLSVGREEYKEHVEREFLKEVEKIKKHIAAKGASHGVDFEFKVRKGKVSDEIILESKDYDAVVLGYKELSGIAKMKSEKTPEKVFKEAKCTVITAR